jgi:photosystem II stability/assembly factor-like uncharacterized protein
MMMRPATTIRDFFRSIGAAVNLRGRRRVAVAAAALVLAAAVALAVVPSWTASPTSLPPGSTAPSTVPVATVDKASSPTSLVPPSSAPFADPGGTVYQMDRLSAESGWALLYVRTVTGAASPHLMFTDDAGATWRDATLPGLTGTPTIDFLDPEHGWVLQILAVDPTNPSAAIPSSLWRTSDGGRHWVLATLPKQGILAATISFIGPNVGYLAVTSDTDPIGDQTLLYSTDDDGSSWTQVGIVSDQQWFDSQWAHPLIFLSKNDGLFVNDNDGSVRQTGDGGRTWKPVSLSRPAEILASAHVYVPDYVLAGSAVLLLADYTWESGGSTMFASGYEFISHDRGETWSPAWSGAPGFEYTKVVAAGEATLFRFLDYTRFVPDSYTAAFTVTNDGGLTWTSVSPVLLLDTHFLVESFANALDGWAVVAVNVHCPDGEICPYITPSSGELVETHDGGLTWRPGSTR